MTTAVKGSTRHAETAMGLILDCRGFYMVTSHKSRHTHTTHTHTLDAQRHTQTYGYSQMHKHRDRHRDVGMETGEVCNLNKVNGWYHG